jgi:hypothetical protein
MSIFIFVVANFVINPPLLIDARHNSPSINQGKITGEKATTHGIFYPNKKKSTLSKGKFSSL